MLGALLTIAATSIAGALAARGAAAAPDGTTQAKDAGTSPPAPV